MFIIIKNTPNDHYRIRGIIIVNLAIGWLFISVAIRQTSNRSSTVVSGCNKNKKKKKQIEKQKQKQEKKLSHLFNALIRPFTIFIWLKWFEVVVCVLAFFPSFFFCFARIVCLFVCFFRKTFGFFFSNFILLKFFVTISLKCFHNSQF